MARRKPCCICRRWFEANPRAGARQRACSAPECQRERHRRACAGWRGRNPDYDREDRLRRKLAPKEPMDAADGPVDPDPLARVPWRVVRDAVGLEVAVVIEELGQHGVRWARDAVASKVLAVKGFSRQVAPSAARDEIGPRGPPP